MKTNSNNLLPVFFGLFCTLSLAVILNSCRPAQDSAADPAQEEWRSLFNGVNLDGWTPKIKGYELGDNFQNTYYVEDSMIKVKYDGYEEFGDRFGHMFYKEPFSYYRLRLEYRFVGEQAPGGPEWAIRNSGVMFHGQPANTMGKDQDFPICMEAQFLGGNGVDERHTLNLCTPGTNMVMNDTLVTDHCIESRSKTYHGEQWVKAELLVLGDSLVQHIVDHEVVLEYSKPQIGGGAVSNFDSTLMKIGAPLTYGTLSLQSESHPIHFRKIELLNLAGCKDPKAKNYKSYYVKGVNGECIY